MKMLRFFIFFFSSFFVVSAFAQPVLTDFMTPRDLENNNAISNINLQNNRSTAVPVYGVYVRQYAYVFPGESCNRATVIFPASDNVTAGAFLLPTVINSGKKAAIGSNFLYNMIYQTIYYENIIIPSSPPGCALPGCTWGSDTTRYNWCIYLGALTPVSNNPSFTSTVPPSTNFASFSTLYNYNLVTHFIYLGPISCNDRTLTCTTATQQTQSFS